MIIRGFIKIGIVTVIVLSLFSCVEGSDLNQTYDITLSPVIERSLIFSKLEATKFLDIIDHQEVVIVSDTTDIDIISSELIVEQLIKATFSYQFKNSLERCFEVDFEFLNDNNGLRYQIHIAIPSGNPSDPILIETNILIEEPDFFSFKDATKMVYKITLPPSEIPLTIESEGAIELQSNAIFYLNN